MHTNPYFEPLFSGHREQAILGKSDLLGVLGLELGDFHLPYTFHKCHAPFQDFIPPFLSSKTSQPTPRSNSRHPVANL